MAYDIYVYNSEKIRIGVVQNISTSDWDTSYFGIGEVAIKCYLTDQNLEILKEGNLLWKSDSLESAWIESVEKDSKSNNPYIIARGYSAKRMLSRRVAMGTNLVSDVVSDLYDLIERNLRGLDIVIDRTNPPSGFTDNMTFDFANLETILLEVLSKHSLTYRIDFLPNTLEHIFYIKDGIDRRSSSEEYVGVMSETNGTISSGTQNIDISNWKNYAVIKTETGHMYLGEEVPQSFRRETVIDLSGFKKTYTEYKFDGNYDEFGNPTFVEVEKTYTDAEYENQIYQQAKYQMNQIGVLNDVQMVTSENTLLVLNKDFFLGDILPCKIEKLGIKFNGRVIDVEYILDSSGFNEIVTISATEVENL